MKQNARGLLPVLFRELGIMIKDMDILVIILLSPLFYGLFYGSAYMHKTEANVPVVVVDEDHSALSRQFIRDLDAHQLIEVKRIDPSLEEAKNHLNAWQTQAIVWIPEGFERQLKRGQQGALKVYLNTSRFLPSNDINRAVQEVAATLNAGLTIRYFESRGLNFEQAREQFAPLKVDDRNLFNTRQTYGDFLIPGILILILQQTMLFGLAMSISRETETKSWAQLYEQAKGSVQAVIGGKSIPYIMLYLGYALFFFTVYFALYRIPFRGNFAVFLLLTFIFLIAVAYLSIFVGTLFERKIITLQFLVFTSYPLFLLSGFSWPLSAMPVALQWFAQLIPLTPYLRAMSRISAMGAGLGDILPELIQLVALSILGLILTRLRIKHYLNKAINAGLDSPVFRLVGQIKN